MVTNGESSLVIEGEVKEIASLLSKAAKNYQMYLSNNRMFLSSLDNLKMALDSYLADKDVLTFVVREFELLHQATTVYSNTDKYQSLAFRMYRDGVRLISFHDGITNDELMAFFEALTRCMETDNIEEDFVTLLWEKDLQSITYYEVNDFEADYEKIKKRMQKKGDQAITIRRPETSGSDANKLSREIESLRPTLTLTAEDLREVRDLAFGVQDDFFLKRAWQVLSLAMDADDRTEPLNDLENALIGFMDTCVSKRQLSLAASVLETIRARYGQAERVPAAESLKKIIASRHTERNILTVEDMLSGTRESEHDECLAYLSHLSRDAIRPVLALLPKCANQSARYSVVASLASIASCHPRDLITCADLSSADETEAVLDVLDMIGSQEALTAAMRLGGHAAPRIRAKVAFAAAKLGTKEARKTVEALVNDSDHAVRRRALVSMVEIGGERTVDTLKQVFTSKEFNLLSHDYKLSMLLVIRSLPQDAQSEIILSIFRMRRFFKRRPIEDTKTALIEILHLMNEETALAALQDLINSSSAKIRKAAENAMRKVRHVSRAN
jgi:hypothetical protein